MPTVFLSSTSKDLTQCREEAYRAIEGLDGYHCVRMEDFGSRAEAAQELCEKKAKECDLFVCIAGPTYGSLSPAGVSYTEFEYNVAVKNHKKPCLVFMTVEDYPLASNQVERKKERDRQARFRKELNGNWTVTRFSRPEEVAYLVSQAIHNWVTSQGSGNPTQAKLLESQVKSASYRVAVLNRSRTISEAEIRKSVAALQTQVHQDFAPVWGVDAELTLIGKDSRPQPNSWWLVIQDEGDYPSIVCYHTLTAEGLPQVKVSVDNAKVAGWPWTMAASHDLLEMLANPSLNLTVFHSQDGKTGRLYPREICDPVSSVEQAYEIDGVVVSDFVYPAWFESFRSVGSAQFDHSGCIFAPFEQAPGAYVHVVDVRSSSGWHYVTGPGNPPTGRFASASRKGKAAT